MLWCDPVRARLTQLVVLLALATPGCGDEPADPDGGACLETLELDCQPAYPPTFRNLFDNELGNTCGASSTGSSCHSARGAMNGLVLETFDAAYAELLGEADDDPARVRPGDPECSLLLQRLESTDPQFNMPPGASSLPENVRCAFRQWIANGAEK